MPILTQRSGGYRVGVVMLIVGFILYTVGFSTISWTTSKRTTEGLWQTRHAGSDGTILYTSNINAEAWLTAVQSLQCIGLIKLFFACVFGMWFNLQQSPSFPRSLELAAGLGSLFGLTGALVYTFIKMASILLSESLSWSYALDISGCALTGIATFVILASNIQPPPPPPDSPIKMSTTSEATCSLFNPASHLTTTVTGSGAQPNCIISPSQSVESYVPQSQSVEWYVPQSQSVEWYVPQSQSAEIYVPQSQSVEWYVPQSQSAECSVSQSQSAECYVPQAQSAECYVPQSQSAECYVPQPQSAEC